MHKVIIEPAVASEADVAARLTFMAYHRFSYDIFGQVGEYAAHDYFRKLWRHGRNRFGCDYSFIAKLDDEPVGLMTCYPSSLIMKLVGPTIRQIFLIGGVRFIWHFLTHLGNFYHFASNQDCQPNELYVATLSVLPEYRRMGVGAEMLRFARRTTLEQGLKRCALHVNAENADGIRFYERNGFTKAPPIEHRATYFRMVYSV